MMRAAILVLAACSGETGVTVAMHVTAAAPLYGAAPFPSDALRDGDHLATIGGLDKIAGLRSDLVAAHVAALDGFGLRPLVELFVDGGLDPASVPARTTTRDDAAALVDVDRDSPERGRVIAME